MMPITQSMISQNMLKNISNSYSQIDKYMDQLSTGKKINRPSDDPVVAMRSKPSRQFRKNRTIRAQHCRSE